MPHTRRMPAGSLRPRKVPMRPHRLLLALTAIAALAASERAVAQGTLRGSVFDSLQSKRPLAGAQVMVAGATGMAITDRNGRYELRDVPAGRRLVSFFHPSLDSLEVSAPALEIQVHDGRTATADLGIPSARGISERLCGVEPAPSTAVLFGLARAAEDGALLSGAVASVAWFEFTLERGVARQSQRTAVDTTGADGRYVLCGVPNDISVALSVESGGQSSGALHLSLDSAEFARFDAAVSLTDPAARPLPAEVNADSASIMRTTGSAGLRAVVLDERRRPIRGAIVGVRGSPVSGVSAADGSLTLAGVPSGSQTLVARAIGWAPAFRVVTLAPGKHAELTVTLTKAPMSLPEVAIVGRRRSSAERSFDLRRKLDFGHFFEGKELDLVRQTSAFWARIPGIYLYESAAWDPMPMMTGARGASSKCFPTVWIDGMRAMSISGWELRTYMIGAQRLEVYTRSVETPAEFQSPANPCGAIVIWTY